jgi:hypothetical protein
LNKYKIVTVDYNIEDERISNILMDSDNSLLDGDIIIIDPLIYDQILLLKETNGIYYNNNIDRIFVHRKNEIKTLLKRGKIIIVFFRPAHIFNFKTGHGAYSSIGTYDFLPIDLRFFYNFIVNATGSIIKNNSKDYLSNLYNTYKEDLKYEVYLEDEFEKENYNPHISILFKDFILRNKTGNVVGFALNINNGKIFFIPYINEYKTPGKLINTVINFCRPLFEEDIKTPEPKWSKNEIYSLPGENEIINKISELEDKKKTLEEEIGRYILQQKEITDLGKLLYEKGKQLEMVTRKAFEKLGFTVSAYNEGDMEHDIILESEEGRIIGEIEGKDKNMLHIEKLDQLSRVIDEDFKNNQEMANGILIGNAFRHKDPQERKNIFSDKVRVSAKRKNIALLSTIELFYAVKNILSSSDSDNEELKKKYREQIFNSMGKEVFFNPNNKDI